MQAALRCRGEIIDCEVAVRYAVDAVGGGSLETERIGSRVAIEREAGAGKRCAAQRGLVHACTGIVEARQITPKHLVIGHQVMAERHRLRDLQVREAGHGAFGMFLGAFDEHALQFTDGVDGFVAGIADPQPEVGRNLVVARSRRVQAARGGADQLAEAMLDSHVDVFELDPFGNAVALIFGGDLVEALEDRGRVGLSDDPLVAEHGGMSLRCRDILTATGACRSRLRR